MGAHHDKRFPGESDDYRVARDKLLSAERSLRSNIGEIARLRQALPPGGPLKEDYLFTDASGTEAAAQIRLSELFEEGKDSLFLYSFMYAESPCPSCTALLDSLNGAAPHIHDRLNFAVVAKAPAAKLSDWAASRNWSNLRLLSAEGNSYNADYFGETADGGQIPAINIFRKTESGIHHSYNSELLYSASEAAQDPRHADMIWPLWNVFDLTPEGRGQDWYPGFTYE